MNSDDFEHQLQRPAMRAVPGQWRNEILRAARQNEAGGQPHSVASNSVWWRELLWPCPQAWAGIAAVWLIIAGLHLAGGGEPHPGIQVTTIPASPETRAMLEEQRRLLAEFFTSPGAPLIRHRAEPADRPRSQGSWRNGFPTTHRVELPPNHFLSYIFSLMFA